MESKGETSRFITFLVTGGLAALANIISRALLSLVFIYQISVILAYLVGMVTAYVLARRYVFEPSGRSVSEELWKFALVNIIAAAQVWLVAMVLNFYALPAINWTFERELISHIIGVASPVITSYLGHKHFSFKARRTDDVR